MANRKAAKKKASLTPTDTVPRTEPKFPYTTMPSSLRRLLKEIPTKPKPDKINQSLLASWGFKNGNDYSMVRVLKAIGLINDSNQPTDRYARFMNPDDAGKALGSEVRRVYAPLFQASHTPHTESAEKLKNLFNIHSGGGEKTMDHQIGTFKALAEHADVSAHANDATDGHRSPGGAMADPAAHERFHQGDQSPVVNINLHIHLPENKSRREYTNIIEDIGHYIFGRTQGGSRD